MTDVTTCFDQSVEASVCWATCVRGSGLPSLAASVQRIAELALTEKCYAAAQRELPDTTGFSHPYLQIVRSAFPMIHLQRG
jgi:hypothetical protein